MATAREDLQLQLATPGQKDRKQLLEYIEKGQIGYNATLQGPYGTRKGAFVISEHYNQALLKLLCYTL